MLQKTYLQETGILQENGIHERQGENKRDCKRIVFQMFKDAGLNLPPLSIEKAHRIGKKSNTKPREILITFFHQHDKDIVMENRSVIQSKCKVRIFLFLYIFISINFT